MIRAYLALVLLGLNPGFTKAQRSENERFPKPTAIPNLLFYIQREPDANTVCYTARVHKNGTVDVSDPVDVFWTMYATDSKRKELTTLQRQFGYGIKSTVNHDGNIELHMVALPKRKLLLRHEPSGKYYVTTAINGRESQLERIFLKITGGSAIAPVIEYIEMKGVYLATKQTAIERLKVE